jgi:hypothetical protein
LTFSLLKSLIFPFKTLIFPLKKTYFYSPTLPIPFFCLLWSFAASKQWYRADPHSRGDWYLWVLWDEEWQWLVVVGINR